MGSVLASMLTVRPNRPISAAVALAVLLGVVTLGAAMGLTSAGAATGESRLTTRPGTVETVEQLVLPAKRLLKRVLVKRRDDRSHPAPSLVALLCSPAAALAIRRSVVARHRRRCPAAAGRLGCVGSRAPPWLQPV
jgi:hypothetical protein